jgi:hypothetical protein
MGFKFPGTLKRDELESEENAGNTKAASESNATQRQYKALRCQAVSP